MTVTYAWKIDNSLYAYIVNDAYLDNGGNLISDYDNEASMPSFMGKLSETRLNEEAEKKIYLYCQNNWSSHSDKEFEWYKECFESMLYKIHNYESPSYFYVSLLDPEIYFNIDEDCDIPAKECCRYIPDGEDVTDCNKQGNYNIVTKYDVGGISKGTPLRMLTGMSFSELFNIIFFGDQCGNISEPDSPTDDYIFVEPNHMIVDAVNRLFVEPSSITVKAREDEDFIFIDPSQLKVNSKKNN